MLGIVILLNFDRLDVFVGFSSHLNLQPQKVFVIIQIFFIGIRRRLFWLMTLHACGFDFTEVLSALVVQRLIYFWAIRLTRMMKAGKGKKQFMPQPPFVVSMPCN